MSKSVISFNVDDFMDKLEINGLTIQDAGLLVGKSKSFWYPHLKSGQIDRSTFFLFHELLRSRALSDNHDEDASQPSGDDDIMNEFKEDHKLIQELGFERIYRLYALAVWEKRGMQNGDNEK